MNASKVSNSSSSSKFKLPKNYLALNDFIETNSVKSQKKWLFYYVLMINHSSAFSKYSDIFYWSGMMVLLPGFQFAGQTTPCSSACLNAFINLKVSSTFLPTCSSFIIIDLIFLFPSITNNPLKVAPWRPSAGFSTRTPYYLDIFLVMSAMRGKLIYPKPPLFLGAFLQAKCEKWESTDIART